MKWNFILTTEQQALVEDGLDVIDKVISRYIHENEAVCGLGWDDLYQEGAMALCKAASTYDGASAQFTTYATTVIRNHLINHCKAVNLGQRHLSDVAVSTVYSEDETLPYFEPSVPDATDVLIGELAAADLLADCKRRYTGVARLGVEALELKIRGLDGADIAKLYHTTPNNVGAWISRAAKKIRKDYPESVEK